MTLGELIKSKGYLKNYIHGKLRKDGVDVDSSHFSRWCTNQFKPRRNDVYIKLAKLLGETEETIRDCFNK